MLKGGSISVVFRLCVILGCTLPGRLLTSNIAGEKNSYSFCLHLHPTFLRASLRLSGRTLTIPCFAAIAWSIHADLLSPSILWTGNRRLLFRQLRNLPTTNNLRLPVNIDDGSTLDSMNLQLTTPPLSSSRRGPTTTLLPTTTTILPPTTTIRPTSIWPARVLCSARTTADSDCHAAGSAEDGYER